MPKYITTPVGCIKKCPKCRAEQPLDEFARDKTRPDGYSTHCKSCVRAYQQANRVRLTQSRGEWRNNHLERAREIEQNYFRNHRERINLKKRRSGYDRIWVAKNRQRKYAQSRNYRARSMQAEGTHTDADIARQYKAQKGKCYWCSLKVGDTYHVDHIIPLSRGGSNWPDNLVIACPTCNSSKKDKLPSEWPQGGRLI